MTKAQPPCSSKTINIAILDCLVPLPSITDSRGGSFSQIFLNLLQSAANQLSTHHYPQQTINIQGTSFNTLLGEYPPNIQDFNAILITGSFASAYDNDEWVLKLVDYIQGLLIVIISPPPHYLITQYQNPISLISQLYKTTFKKPTFITPN